MQALLKGLRHWFHCGLWFVGEFLFGGSAQGVSRASSPNANALWWEPEHGSGEAFLLWRAFSISISFRTAERERSQQHPGVQPCRVAARLLGGGKPRGLGL